MAGYMEDWEIALADLRAELLDKISDLQREVDELREQIN